MSLELTSLVLLSRFPSAEHKLVALYLTQNSAANLNDPDAAAAMARFVNVPRPSLWRLCLDLGGLLDFSAEPKSKRVELNEDNLRELAAGRAKFVWVAWQDRCFWDLQHLVDEVRP